MVNEEGGWSWDIFARNLPANVLSRIAAIRPPSNEASIDILALRWSSGGLFPVAKTHEQLAKQSWNNKNPKWALIWGGSFSQRIKQFLWLLANDKIQTNAVRHHWGMTTDEFCTICGQTRESNLRAMRDCWAAVVLWKSLVPSQSQNWFFSLSLDKWLQENLSNSEGILVEEAEGGGAFLPCVVGSCGKIGIHLCFIQTMWELWL